MEVNGKTAIVLGGTSGIGLATTNRLTELGAKVIAVSRDPDKAKDIVAHGVELRSCSVLDRAGLKALFDEWSKFDILVCAATGGARAAGPFLEMDLLPKVRRACNKGRLLPRSRLTPLCVHTGGIQPPCPAVC